MATLDATSRLTLLEGLNRIDPKGDAVKIAEVLNRENEILNHIPWIEANSVFNHEITRRLSLPTATRRVINQGVPLTASRTTKSLESITIYEDRSEIDVLWVQSQPNPAQARNAEALSHIEGISQQLVSDIFYSTPGSGAEYFSGLALRMDALSTNRIVGCSGTGSDTSSIYIVQWGEGKVYGVYPRGAKNMGVVHEDLGIESVADSSGNKLRAYVDMFQTRFGLAVENDRCIARVANIETSGVTNTLDEDKIMTVLNHMPNGGAGAYLYMNPTIWDQLCRIAKDKTNVNYTAADPFGRPLKTFMGHTIALCDAIVNTETAIS